MREIISVGASWVNETGGRLVVPTQADHRMLCEMQKAYHAGYKRGKRAADAGFFSGLIWGSVVWIVCILIARAI